MDEQLTISDGMNKMTAQRSGTGDEGNERVRSWLDSAIADAERRGLPQLNTILQAFARATAALRAADWNTCDE